MMPDSPIVHIYRAERLLHLQKNDEALTEIDRSLEMNPNVGKARYLRGKMLQERGDEEGARLELGLAIRLGLEDEDRAEAVRRLVGLNARP